MRRFDVAPVDTSADADTADQYAGESQPPRRRQRDSRHGRSRVAWRRHCGGRTGAGAATTAPATVATIEVALAVAVVEVPPAEPPGEVPAACGGGGAADSVQSQC